MPAEKRFEFTKRLAAPVEQDSQPERPHAPGDPVNMHDLSPREQPAAIILARRGSGANLNVHVARERLDYHKDGSQPPDASY
jgi:hypothetical protein